MEELKQRILRDGRIIDNRILKVDNFLNHQIDTALVSRMGEEFARRFKDVKVDRIATIESSGIAIACAVSMAMGSVPVVFGRKRKSLLSVDDMYHASIYSYTKEETYDVIVSKKYLPAGESVLNIDDFLASGEAALGMAKLILQAQCKVAGIGIVIEKSFQKGRGRLEEAGYRVESLARIAKFENDKPVFVAE